MARVELKLAAVSGSLGIPYFRPEDRSNTVYRIPTIRLTIRLFVLPLDAVSRDRPDDLPPDWEVEVAFDTGAPLTIFPFDVWQPFAAAAQWLGQPPQAARTRVAVLGGRFASRLGRVRFGAADDGGNRLPAVASSALFLDSDPAAPKQAVLGLRTRLFERRHLRCADVPAAAFGQVWALEDI